VLRPIQSAIFGGGAQHKFHHDAHPQMVRRFYKPGEQRINVQAKRRVVQVVIQAVGIGGYRRASLACLSFHPAPRRDRQQVYRIQPSS